MAGHFAHALKQVIYWIEGNGKWCDWLPIINSAIGHMATALCNVSLLCTQLFFLLSLKTSGAFNCVQSNQPGKEAIGPECCNNYYTGCACPEGSCCDYKTGKCLVPESSEITTMPHCTGVVYANMLLRPDMTLHGSCKNTCPCRCQCATKLDCEECSCWDDPNPCEPYCFACDEDDRDGNCAVCDLNNVGIWPDSRPNPEL